MKPPKVLSYFATVVAVVLTSVLVVGGATEQPAKALAACIPNRTATSAGNTYVEFTTVTAGCTWTVPSGVTSIAEVLIVAGGGGGGGGGKWGGGGGAGEVISLSSVSVGSSVDIAVGSGGSVGSSTFCIGGIGVGASGGTSFFGSSVAFGGGGGGPDHQGTKCSPTPSTSYFSPGANGGSGGGTGETPNGLSVNWSSTSTAATSSPSGYGNAGGNYKFSCSGGYRGGSGGGGAGAQGGSLDVCGTVGGVYPGGAGGNGTNLFHTLFNENRLAVASPTLNSTLGVFVSADQKYYVAGGGSGSQSVYTSGSFAAGGYGGGGIGYNYWGNNLIYSCTNGTAKTGGGGGSGCAGGSGFVLIKYTTPSAVTYSISYNANSATSGSVPSDGSYTTGGSAYTVASNSGTLARTGYDFVGWNTLADGSGTTYVASSGTLTTSSNLTLYAKWTLLTYSITYNSNSSTSGSVPGVQTKTYGVDLTVASNSGMLERTGYGFAGWNTLADGSGTTYAAGSGTLTANSSATLYAKWTANTLTVTYDSQFGSAITAGSTTTGGSISASPGTPSRTGYEFAGWFAASSGGAAISFPYTHGQTSSFVLYAQWTANSLTVTYDSQLGSAITAGSTTTGGSIASPGTPSRTGYGFAGWFAASSGGAAISFPYAHGQTSSFTLYAQWTANSLTVTYDSQLGTAITAGSTTTGGSISASPGTPSRTGYEFAGWFAASSGGAAISFPYAHGQTSSFTLYAQWSANSLTVTYDSQLGTAITAGSSITGGSISASPGMPSRTGYTFTGWYASATGGTAISFPYVHGQTASFTLYAQWSANSLTITYDSQVGSGITAGATITGGSILASPGTPSRTGYTFTGWFAAATGGAAISFPYAHGQTSSFVLYAQWTANSLTVTYDSQLGSAITAGSTTTGSSIASPGTPSRTGYGFAGWFTASSGGALISFPYTHGQTSSFVVYAQWTANALTVTFDSQLGTAITAGSTTTGGSIASPGTPSRTGYEFTGWFAASSGGALISFPYAHGQTSSFVLYAQWSANSLTITYDSQLGSAITAGSTTTGGSISASPGTPSRTGYTFTGWFVSATGGTAISFPHVHGQTTNFIRYAQWTQTSLYGLGSKTKIGTITTANGVGNTFAAETAVSSVTLRYPADGLPAGTVIDVYLVNDLSRAGKLIERDGGFVISLVVAWVAADGSVPLTATDKPISMTIANTTIKAGAKTYAILGGVVTLIGTATTDGTVTVLIYEDPEIVVVNPMAIATPAAKPIVVTPAPAAVNAPAAPAATPPVAIPVVVTRSWSITFLPYVASVFRNSQVAWSAFASSQGSSVLSCSITGVSPSEKSKANNKLFENRQTSLITMLKYNGCEKVAIRIPSRSTQSATINRTWKVDVEPSASAIDFNWTHDFKTYSSVVDRKQVSQWSAFIADNNSAVLSCSITGVEPLTKSKANTQLFDKRNESLKAYLLSSGCASVQMSKPIGRKEKLASRTIWKVAVDLVN